MKCGLKKNSALEEVTLKKEDNVIYVDFVLTSMLKEVDEWYTKYYKDTMYDTYRRSHKFQLIRMYDHEQFKNHETLGKERADYLAKIDLHVQMRR